MLQTTSLYSRVIENASSPDHVVILHGLFAASDNLLRLGKYLSESYTVHLLDLRNHGNSPHLDEMNYPLMAADVHRYISERGLSSVAVIGHSMGGKTAMQLALDYPELVKAIVVGDIAPVRYEPSHQGILAGLTAISERAPLSRAEADERLMEFIDELAVRQFLIKGLRKQEGKDGLAVRFNLHAIKANYLALIDAPKGAPFEKEILFISGQESEYILPAHQKKTLSLFPHAQLKVIPGTGHWLHAEKPDVFNALCARFLSKS